MERDKATTVRFEARGWTVLRIWECELKKKNNEQLIQKIDILLGVAAAKYD